MAAVTQKDLPAETQAFTVDEFAEAFRVSRATVYNMWRDGAGPARMRVRGRVLISRTAAEKWRQQVEAQLAAA
jgi:excisionase family DNA binding protein